jgi:hypothetical protein
LALLELEPPAAQVLLDVGDVDDLWEESSLKAITISPKDSQKMAVLPTE